MPSPDLTERGLVGLPRDSLAAIHQALFRDVAGNAPAILQEAGYAGGAAAYDAFTRWCGDHGVTEPDGLSPAEFGEWASAFFAELGWGPISVNTLHDSALTVDANAWAEANPAAGLQFPGCYFSAGLLADFFGRLAGSGEPLVSMEVECRSMGYERCRFLLAGAETIQHVYDGLVNGVAYEESLAQMPG